MCYAISWHIDGLMQERCNSSALALELHLSCTNPSTSVMCTCNKKGSNIGYAQYMFCFLLFYLYWYCVRIHKLCSPVSFRVVSLAHCVNHKIKYCKGHFKFTIKCYIMWKTWTISLIGMQQIYQFNVLVRETNNGHWNMQHVSERCPITVSHWAASCPTKHAVSH